jgi:hypothetical protein
LPRLHPVPARAFVCGVRCHRVQPQSRSVARLLLAFHPSCGWSSASRGWSLNRHSAARLPNGQVTRVRSHLTGGTPDGPCWSPLSPPCKTGFSSPLSLGASPVRPAQLHARRGDELLRHHSVSAGASVSGLHAHGVRAPSRSLVRLLLAFYLSRRSCSSSRRIVFRQTLGAEVVRRARFRK